MSDILAHAMNWQPRSQYGWEKMEHGKKLSPETVNRLQRPMPDPQEVLSAAAWQKRKGNGEWLNISVNKFSDLPEELDLLRKSGWELRPLFVR